MGKRYDKKWLLLDNQDDPIEINDFDPEFILQMSRLYPFPTIEGNTLYTLEDIISDSKAINVWTIPKDTPLAVRKWIENALNVRVVKCNVIYESIEWVLLEWTEC